MSDPCVTIRARSATVNSRTASASYPEKYTVVAMVAMSHGRIVSVCVASVGMNIGIAKEAVSLELKVT